MLSSATARKTEDDQFPAANPAQKFAVIGGTHKHIGLLVAIPAYNEEIAIGSVVARAIVYADKVVVVDDGSQDRTAEVARLVGADVVTHEKNGGYGAAIRTCFNIAKTCNADVMVILDADGQHSPSDIPLLLEEMKRSGADIVIGSRFYKGNSAKDEIPAYRKIGMKILDTATAVVTGISVTDTQSGFRAYSRNAIRQVRPGNTGMGIGSEIIMGAAEANLKISEAPITIRYDIKGSSSTDPLSHGLSVLNSIVGMMLQKRPMVFFGVPGLILMIIGTSLGFLLVDVFNSTRTVAVFYAMSSTLCVLLGALSVFTGFTLTSIKNFIAKPL